MYNVHVSALLLLTDWFTTSRGTHVHVYMHMYIVHIVCVQIYPVYIVLISVLVHVAQMVEHSFREQCRGFKESCLECG